MTGKQMSPERPTPKSPIYSCEVIQTACLALEALQAPALSPKFDRFVFDADAMDAMKTAIRIIRDGLASQERAIKGETT